jgi:hypothetical protein
MAIDNFFANSKADSCSGKITFSRKSSEDLENLGEIMLRNSDAIIGDGKNGMSLLKFAPDLYFRVF